MVKATITKLLTAISGIALFSAITSVNSACFLTIGEPEIPEAAYKLVK